MGRSRTVCPLTVIVAMELSTDNLWDDATSFVSATLDPEDEEAGLYPREKVVVVGLSTCDGVYDTANVSVARLELNDGEAVFSSLDVFTVV